MKQKMVPESVAELLALWAGKIPLPVVDTLFPLVKARSLMAADRLGVFEALRAEPLRAEVLAGGLGLHADSLRLLLRVLAASGARRRRRRGQLEHPRAHGRMAAAGTGT